MKKQLLACWKAIYISNSSMLFSLAMFAVNAVVFTPSSYAEVEKARSADSFVDSIGINVHLDYDDTPYKEYDSIVKPRLEQLGVRHIRTSVWFKDSKTHHKLKDLANMGIKTNLVMDPRLMSPEETVKLVKSLGNSVIESVEGPNEWNAKRNVEYQGKKFLEGLANYQADLYSAIKRDPATAHLPVLAPSMSEGHQLQVSIDRLGKLDCDINNMHSYPGDKIPSTSGLDVTSIPYSLKTCGKDKPLMATETGYQNALKHPKGISERAAARYMTRLLLEYFNRGIKRTYTYELINLKPNPQLDEREHNWGLLRANGSPKQAFIAIRNLIELLHDPEAQGSKSISLSSLDYTLKGNKEDINHTLLQKKDGKFYLILWQETASYDRQNRSDIKVPYRSLKVVLNTKISNATVYKPNWKREAVLMATNPKTISVGVSDYPLVIELTPKQ